MKALRHGFLAGIFLFAPAIATPAMADSVEIVSDGSASTEGLGSFTGLLTYESEMFSTSGVLTVMLTNTSEPSNGGFITAFLFNMASSDEDAQATLLSDPAPSHPFIQATGDGLSGMPFGKPFDAGAALDGRFSGDGSPAEGIAVGETGTFTFGIEADDAGELSAIDFLEGGPFGFNFLVRFRGFEDGGSDKVPAAALIPLPAPVALGALGLVGVIVVSRRRRAPAL